MKKEQVKRDLEGIMLGKTKANTTMLAILMLWIFDSLDNLETAFSELKIEVDKLSNQREKKEQ